MADATVTISGDSSDAQSAVQKLDSEVDGLSSSIDRASTSSRGLSSDSSMTTTSMRGLSTAAHGTSDGIDDASSSMQMLGGAISEVNPALGGAIQLTAALGEGIVGLVRSISPWTLALAGAAAAIGGVAFALSKMKQPVSDVDQQVASLNDRLASLQGLSVSLRTDLTSFAESLAQAAVAAGGVSGAVGEVNRLLEQQKKSVEAVKRAEIKNEYDALSGAAAHWSSQLVSLNKQQQELQAQASRSSDELRAMDAAQRSAALASQRWARTQLPLVAKKIDVTRAKLRTYGERIASARYQSQLLSAASEAASSSIDKVAKSAESASSSMPDYGQMASGMIKAAVAARDFSSVFKSIGTSGLGAALFQSLSKFSDEQLSKVGALNRLLSKRSSIRSEMLTGVESLSAALDKINAKQAASAATMGASVAGGVASMAAGLSGGIGSAAAEAQKEASRKAQDEWFQHVRESYAYRKQQEVELTQLSLARARQGLSLSGKQKEAVTAHYDKIRAADKAREERRKAMIKSFKDQAKGIMKSGLGNMVSNVAAGLGEMAVQGKDAGEGIAKGAAQAIAGLAKSFGAFLLTTGLGFLFVPGMRARGAAMMAAGTALLVIGGAAGAAAKNKSKGAEGGGGSSVEDGGGATFVISTYDTYGQRNPGKSARDERARQRNADRYGIDRGRAWA